MVHWQHTTLRLTCCPTCNYDISRLPARSRCPECGFAYDEKMFMLEGWRLPDGRAWLRTAIVYGPIAFIALGALRYEFGWSRRVLGALVAGGALLVGLLYLAAWRRDRIGRRVLARYLITEDGVARPGRRTVYLWRNYSHLMLMSDRSGWRLHLYPSWWRILGPPLVNARLKCAEPEAEAVRDEIQRRISAARRAEAESKPRTLPRRWW